LKEDALDRTVWGARFGRGFGPVVRQTTKWMNLVCMAEDAQRVLVTKLKGKRSFRTPCRKCDNISMTFYVFHTLHCNIIVLHKSTKCTFVKLIF
jgi:hypothetical protein